MSKRIQPLTQDINHKIEGGEDAVVKVFFSQLIPDVLNWIQFRTVGRLRDQANILRDHQIFGIMPARSIDLHHYEMCGERLIPNPRED